MLDPDVRRQLRERLTFTKMDGAEARLVGLSLLDALDEADRNFGTLVDVNAGLGAERDRLAEALAVAREALDGCGRHDAPGLPRGYRHSVTLARLDTLAAPQGEPT